MVRTVTDVVSHCTVPMSTLAIMHDWLKTCMGNRPDCNVPHGAENWYPTRLLDCGSPGNLDTHCRLIDTNDEDVQG
jgi:hypothetical protein